MAGAGKLVAHIAQGGKILRREADRIEQRDLICRAPANGLPGDDTP